MINVLGDRLEVHAAMNLGGASALLTEGVAALTNSGNIFDLGAVTEVDSSGLAVVFGWLRAAQAQGKSIRIANPPKNLLSLAEVYGVTALIPFA